nr:putative ribonuclease H-like domain-containing protein [Tanacetum cinerariifolium]
MKLFGCPVTILNTLDHLGKFEGKGNEGFLVRYSVNSKAFRVFNSRTMKVKENLHIKFLENKSNVVGRGPEWLFDIDSLKKSMNYEPVTVGNQTNDDANIEINVNAGQARQKKAYDHKYILLPFMPFNSPLPLSTQSSDDKDADEAPSKRDKGVSKGWGIDNQERFDISNQDVNTIEPSINNANTNLNTGSLNINTIGSNDLSMSSLEETGIFDDVYDDREVDAEADTNNLELLTVVSLTPTTRVHKDHPKKQIIRDLNLANQTRRMINFSKENDMDRSNKVILAYASFMRLIVYQIDVKSAFLYGTLKEEDLRAWYETLSAYLLENRSRKDDVQEILNEFYEGTHFLLRVTASTLMEHNKELIKDAEAKYVDVHLYRSMIGSLMYFTAFRPDIMFAVCACARDSPFDLEAFSNSDYARVILDMKSTIRGCQFLGKRLISWQCKKQTIVANSTTEAEYVAVANCYGHVLWIQNQMLDYGFNFMNTKIYIDNKNRNVKFHQMVDFLTSNPIHYALTVSPTIYASYIEQFWATAKSKTVNDVKQILAKVDGKTVVISESSVRSDLHFNDEDGMTYLSNDEIFENLALMGYERVSTKLTFPINGKPFNDVYVTPANTKKVFTNMKRQNKDFSRTVTPLFDTMLVPLVVEGKGSRQSSEPQPPSSTAPPKQVLAAVSQPQKTHTPRRTKRGWDTEIPQASGPPKKVGDEAVYIGEDDRVVRAITTAASLEAEKENGSGPRRHVTTLGDTDAQTRVLALKKFKTAQDLVIKRLRKKVKRLEKKQRERTPRMKLLKIGTFKKKNLDKENDVNVVEPVSTAGNVVNAASVIFDVSAAGPSTSTARDIFEDEMTTIVDILMAIRSIRPRITSVVIHNVKEEPRRATPLPTEKAIEQEAKDDALIEQMEDVQARMDADILLAKRLQQEEREQFTINKQARMLVDLIAERKREQKWINDFVPVDSKVVNDSEQQAKSSKKRSRADHDK